jgi:hypothetical protein
MCIGAPIAISEKTRGARLCDAAHEEVKRLVQEARAMVDDAG